MVIAPSEFVPTIECIWETRPLNAVSSIGLLGALRLRSLRLKLTTLVLVTDTMDRPVVVDPFGLHS